jgi:hypothetical protein
MAGPAHPPRAPVLASSEVSSYYVQYNRGWSFAAWFFFFGAVLFAYAVVSLLSFSDRYSAILCSLIGTVLIALGVLVYLVIPTRSRLE